MTSLLFISRVAFICNICMLIAFMMRYVSFITDAAVQSTIIIAGFIMAVVFNLISVLWVGVILLKADIRKNLRNTWLFIINFLCLIFQLYFLQK